jgi:hypothetical protein
MKKKNLILLLLSGTVTGIALMGFTLKPRHKSTEVVTCAKEEPACVFRTLLGMQKFDATKVNYDPRALDKALETGISWLLKAQQTNGGWGAGSHSAQNIRDPHAVPADPAATSLSAMALLRTDAKPFQGKYADALKKAVNYLVNAVENSSPQSINITDLTNTQPQTKLGKNIDVILTAQFFTNALHHVGKDAELKKKMENALEKCVAKIQKGQNADGSFKDGGWAPVLQSALANNALENARSVSGVKVDDKVLEKSRDYQKKNYDMKSNSASTSDGAGVMLYSISSSSRASAQEAKQAADKIEKAKKEGKLKPEAKVTEENLVIAGYSSTEAEKLATAYQINKASAQRAQESGVMSGFGSNGGEEFLSYLMTGESLIISGGDDWKQWYEKMSGRLTQVQNEDGSWSGHHCITSPVFCTATCLLVLSIDKDIDFLIKLK